MNDKLSGLHGGAKSVLPPESTIAPGLSSSGHWFINKYPTGGMLMKNKCKVGSKKWFYNKKQINNHKKNRLEANF